MPIESSDSSGLVRALGLRHASAIVVGIIIGSGIFLVPRRMMEATGSVGLVFLAWIVGGVLTYFSGLTFAELGAMKPGPGGEYVYVRDAYGPRAGFLYAWTTFLISKPASIATVAAGMVRILGEFPALAFFQHRVFGESLPVNYGHLVAITVLIGLTWLNFLGVKKAGEFQLFSTILKVGMILGIIAIGFSAKSGGLQNFSTTFPGAVGGFGGFMAALIAALWAYDGANNLNMVAGEIKDPGRNVPRSLIIGIGIVAALYMLTYASVQWALPASEVAAAQRPASAAVQAALGPIGGMIISAGIALSMFVTLNGQLLAGARVPFAAAADGSFFPSLAKVHPVFHTPHNALIFQTGLTIFVFVVGGSFEDLFNLALFAEWLFYGITASTLFVFRMRNPEMDRPYRIHGYPWVPAMFILASAVLLVFTFKENLRNSVLGAIVILAGLPVYWFFHGRAKKSA